MRTMLGLLFASVFLPCTGLVAATQAGTPVQAAADLTYHFIPEDQISLDALHTLFNQAFLPNKLVQDGTNKYLEVSDADGLIVDVEILKDDHVIQFYATWGFKPNVADSKKLDLVNKLNDQFVIARYCDSRAGAVLWSDYGLDYSNGILDADIITAFHEFVYILNSNIGRFDWKDLIQ